MRAVDGRARGEELDLRLWRSPAVRWAAVYLAVAGALMAVAGSELSGPPAETRARRVEERAIGEMKSTARTALGVAGSWMAAEEERRSRRRVELESSLAAAVGWAEQLVSSSRGRAPDFAVEAGRLTGVLPDTVALAILAPSGAALFEAGGSARPETEGALSEPIAGGRTVVVAWANERGAPDELARRALCDALAPGMRVGTGLYFLTGTEGTAIEVSPRPVPGASTAAALDPGAPSPVVVERTGDLETGRLITVRHADRGLGWTAAVERFLSPELLTDGGRTVTGMVALSCLGLVAAAAFAHALRASLVGGAVGAELIAEGPVRPRSAQPVPVPHRPARTAERTGQQEIGPAGGSILRLREAFGESGTGPDLAACARSPILRALSRHLRSGNSTPLPRELREWMRAA